MLVKIFGRGKGGGQGVIGYLLGKNYINDNSQIRDGATLLNGDQGNRTIKTYQTTTVREKTYFAKPAFYNV